jgi:hypothetical protein
MMACCHTTPPGGTLCAEDVAAPLVPAGADGGAAVARSAPPAARAGTRGAAALPAATGLAEQAAGAAHMARRKARPSRQNACALPPTLLSLMFSCTVAQVLTSVLLQVITGRECLIAAHAPQEHVTGVRCSAQASLRLGACVNEAQAARGLGAPGATGSCQGSGRSRTRCTPPLPRAPRTARRPPSHRRPHRRA